MKARPYLLVADHCCDRAQTIQSYFSARGYQVAVTKDGVECYTQLIKNPPHVLLLDVELLWGGHDGVMGIIYENIGLARLQVLLIGDKDSDTNPHSIRTHSVHPPFSTDVLFETVNMILAFSSQSDTADDS